MTDGDTGATSLPGVFAGGDVATGGATVILERAAGRRVARSIDELLRHMWLRLRSPYTGF
ncbi:MAG: hypothetical protein M3132_01320 [Actinomycetia bacterium]|nr:hypothetical protein [Actinomycetes bacterium]